MTPEQRIAQLEAELAREREEKARLWGMVETFMEKERAETAAKTTRRARNQRHRQPASQRASSETSHETPAARLSAHPPPLDGSPPLPAPISPSPLSSPPTLFSVASQSETPVAAAPAKRQPGKSNALGEFIDWARAETRKHLAPDAPDNCRMEPHQSARLGQCVKEHGLAATKAAFGLWMGWEGSRAVGYPLGMFAAKWEGWVGRVKAPAVAPSQTTNSVGRGEDAEGECSGCGASGREATGYLASYGEGTTRLGSRCGCGSEWQASGLSYTEVEKWARERRARAA